MQFVYRAVPTQAMFGVGYVERLGRVLASFGAERVLFVTTPSGKSRYSHIHSDPAVKACGIFDKATSHCPQEVIDQAIATFHDLKADSVVAIGGGSTLGVGKILKAEHGANFVAIPTTYSGSEITPIYGRKIDGEKRTKVDHAAIPTAVIYDPELTLSLPADQTAATGMNSIAHLVEGLYPQHPNPYLFAMNLDALAKHARALPRCVKAGDDIEARTDALEAAFIGGLSVSQVGVALHHALGHVVGGLFPLEHGDYNSAILPHVMAFNSHSAPDAEEAISKVLASDEACLGLYDLGRKIGAPAGLRDLGMPESGIALAVEAIMTKDPRNPRSIDEQSMTQLLRGAWEGSRPSNRGYLR